LRKNPLYLPLLLARRSIFTSPSHEVGEITSDFLFRLVEAIEERAKNLSLTVPNTLR